MLRYAFVPIVSFTEAGGQAVPVRDLLEPSILAPTAQAPQAATSDPLADRTVSRGDSLVMHDGTPVVMHDGTTAVIISKLVYGGT